MPAFFTDKQIENYENAVERLAKATTTDQYLAIFNELLVIIKKVNAKIKKYTYSKSDRWLESDKGQCFIDTYECEWISQQQWVQQIIADITEIVSTEWRTGFNAGVFIKLKNDHDNFIYSSPDFEFDY